jgi:hypothetical protein
MRPPEVGASQNSSAEIEYQNQILFPLEFAFELEVAALNHGQNGGDVRRWLLYSRSFRFQVDQTLLKPLLPNPLGFGSTRSLPNEGRQVLHHRPVVVRTFLRIRSSE